jgi:hypothetical protein
MPSIAADRFLGGGFDNAHLRHRFARQRLGRALNSEL